MISLDGVNIDICLEKLIILDSTEGASPYFCFEYFFFFFFEKISRKQGCFHAHIVMRNRNRRGSKVQRNVWEWVKLFPNRRNGTKEPIDPNVNPNRKSANGIPVIAATIITESAGITGMIVKTSVEKKPFFESTSSMRLKKSFSCARINFRPTNCATTYKRTAEIIWPIMERTKASKGLKIAPARTTRRVEGIKNNPRSEKISRNNIDFCESVLSMNSCISTFAVETPY
jgi:hypothetical protein